jgi:hypothetical protein
MDEPSCLPGLRWGHLRYVLVLVVLAAGLRSWQLWHTEVATRDSIGFIRYAWRLHGESWPRVIRDSEQHPVYPFLIHLASGPVRALVPHDLPRAMQLTAQLVSCLAGVLLVVPTYFLGRELFDRRVGFWAAVLFQCLPSSGRILADGLAEPVFLLLVESGLLFACWAVRSRRVGWFVLTGLMSGLAYLTRTEGLLVAAVTGLVLVGLQWSRTWRRDWWAFGRAGLGLTAATLVVAGPFMCFIGGISLKPGIKHIFGKPGWAERVSLRREGARLGEASSAKPQAAEEQAHVIHAGLPLAMWNYKLGIKSKDRYGWAARALIVIINKGFFHFLSIPFLVGLFLFRRRLVQVPGMWVVLLQGIVLAAGLYRLGQSTGYLSERHALLIVVNGLFWAVATLDILCGWVARRVRRVEGSVLLVGLLAVLAVLPLPKTLAPLHADRAGFRAAGRWLAGQVEPGDVVIDPFAWSSYHAGLGLVIPVDHQAPEAIHCHVVGGSGQHSDSSGAPACYVVLDRSRSTHGHLWYLIEPAEALAKQGDPVRRFPVQAGKDRGEVIVYRVPKWCWLQQAVGSR